MSELSNKTTLRSLAFAAMLFFETVPVKLCGRFHPAHNDCRDGPPYGCPRVPFWRCNIYGISGAPASIPAPQRTCSPAGSRSPHEIYAPRVPESYRSYTPVSPLTRASKGLACWVAGYGQVSQMILPPQTSEMKGSEGFKVLNGCQRSGGSKSSKACRV